MAYKVFDDFSADSSAQKAPLTLHAEGQTSIDLPDASYVRDADLQRDGMDLILEGPKGTVVIENYFSGETSPTLIAPSGETLTPELVQSFAHSPAQYAQNLAMNDASHVGVVEEVSGTATVIRSNGNSENISIGTRIFQGDVIETDAEGAVNIKFIDETTFAVSEDARLAIDEYVFDPDTQSGSSNFSVLKGVFVFTSGLIGRDDPDDVQIDTPVGSIGIRGTIIMGNIDTGEITVVEGAIVMRDFQGHEVTLASQFESAKFVPGSEIESMGVLSANDVGNRFASIAVVSPTLFSSLEDAATEDTSMLVASTVAADAPAEAVEEATVVEKPAEEIVIAAVEQPAEAQAPQPVAETTQAQPMLPPLPLPGANTFTGQTATFDGKMAMMASGPIMPPPPPPGSGPAPTQTAANTLPPPTIPTGNTGDGSLPPPLLVDIQTFGIPENATGNFLVARLIGQFSPLVNYSLIDPTSAYTLIRLDDRTAEIRMNVSTAFDRESGAGLPPLGFHATNGSGSATINGPINVPIWNVNEAPILMGQADTGVSPQYFQASEGTGWFLNLRDLFKDQDFGDNLNFRLSGASETAFDAIPAGYFASHNIAPDGSIIGDTLFLDFANTNFSTLGGNRPFSLEIIAEDDGGLSVTPFIVTFNIRDAQYNTIGATITGGPDTHSDTLDVSNTTTISSDGNWIFGNGGDDHFTLNGADGNQINGGMNDDEFSFIGGNTGNILIGGQGADRYNISTAGSIDNQFLGMQGDDTFVLNSVSLGPLTSSNVTGMIMDGGHGYDTLLLSGGGNLDFGAIFDTHNNTIRNIEHIDMRNAANNTLSIDFDDVLRLSGQDRVLRIDRSSGDTINIDTEGNTWGSQVISGYTAYEITDGVDRVTLLVENTGAAANVV